MIYASITRNYWRKFVTESKGYSQTILQVLNGINPQYVDDKMIKDDCSNVKQVTGVILHGGAEILLIGLVSEE